MPIELAELSDAELDVVRKLVTMCKEREGFVPDEKDIIMMRSNPVDSENGQAFTMPVVKKGDEAWVYSSAEDEFMVGVTLLDLKVDSLTVFTGGNGYGFLAAGNCRARNVYFSQV